MDRRTEAPAPAPLTPARRVAFTAIALSLPFLLLALVEAGMRLADPAGGLPLWVESPLAPGYLTPNPRVTARWFTSEANPPAPLPELLARQKPAKGFRLFVLGESTTAGFPYPRNALFSRMLADALRDVLPDDSVEVVNLGIAATTTWQIRDLAGEILAQRPDGILVYAGHNEYYGALGAASRESAAASPTLVRAYLALLRLRTVLALRNGLARVRGAREREGPAEEASFMESLARDREVPMGSASYDRGVAQLEENLGAVVARFRRAGVPVLVASLASNVRDQAPFASPANDAPGGAVASWREARSALESGDTTRARDAFVRARDLDVVRFRAPSAFNDVIARVARANGATYVPVAEAFSREAPGGIPGRELFLEHVHPTASGYALLARTFYASLRDAKFLGRRADESRLRAWDAYAAARWLTPFDERVAAHTVATLTARWPFVPAAESRDYRGTYRPVDAADSLALAVSRGVPPWQAAKLQLAESFARSGAVDAAVAELRGMARDLPMAPEPLVIGAKLLLGAGRREAAESLFLAARARRPSAEVARELGTLAGQRRDIPATIGYLEESLRLEPGQPRVLYQASLAYAMAGDASRARERAVQAARLDPSVPGLREWLATLGIAP